MRNTQNLIAILAKTNDILSKEKKMKSITNKITKKKELRKRKYIRRTRKKNGSRYMPNRDTSDIFSDSFQNMSNNTKEISISSEGFDIFKEIEHFGSSEMISTYDVGNIFSPVSGTIFGESNTIFDLSSSNRKQSLWSKFYFFWKNFC